MAPKFSYLIPVFRTQLKIITLMHRFSKKAELTLFGSRASVSSLWLSSVGVLSTFKMDWYSHTVRGLFSYNESIIPRNGFEHVRFSIYLALYMETTQHIAAWGIPRKPQTPLIYSKNWYLSDRYVQNHIRNGSPTPNGREFH